MTRHTKARVFDLARREADEPSSPVVRFGENEPLSLMSGAVLSPWQCAYQTYGTLNADRTNAILICHALTGDQHVANVHPATGKPGWWQTMVGPGRPFDTDRFFVICANVLGGCMGTTGPSSTNAATGKPWALDLPVVTIRDMVNAQAKLIDHLGIDTLFAVAGGSMGGMQVLEWAASYPERVFAALPIATAARHSAQNIAFGEVGRQAVMADPEWRGGRYLEDGTRPGEGPGGGAHGRRTSRTSPRRRCTPSSAAACRTAPRPASASTPTSRSRAICATRASASSSASTPTPISM